MRWRLSPLLVTVASVSLVALACSSAGSTGTSTPGDVGGSSGAGGGAGSIDPGTGGSGETGGSIQVGGQGGSGTSVDDPVTCDEAAARRTYVGCDYWPTVTTNAVSSVFDYAVVVANSGATDATVTVTRGDASIGQTTVAAGTLKKLYLPWVPELKGPDNTCGSPKPMASNVGVKGGAYHLVSDVPVVVYQFSALEYQGKGGPPGKDWSKCASCGGVGDAFGCYSYTNDASLLLPSTALTGNYRLAVPRGAPFPVLPQYSMGAYFAVTGTVDNTHVKVQLSGTAQLFAGAGLAAAKAGEVVSFTLNRGDVIELASPAEADLSGSQLQADKPVQVIGGIPCSTTDGASACDHMEESLPPAETLGQHYLVASPTGPNGDAPGQVVRLHGNVDNTQLTYLGSPPAGAPATINAGQVIDLGVVKAPFEVTGSAAFLIAVFQQGGSVVDPQADENASSRGDPAMSLPTPVEQFRSSYVFLAPDDYEVSYADILVPDGATVQLDGKPLSAPLSPISPGFSIARAELPATGAHTLTASAPVDLQVMGYGAYTSYQYPGGLNLRTIAPPPPPIQ